MIKSLCRYLFPIFYSIAVILLGCINPDPSIALTPPRVDSVYEYRTLHSPDGIGKFYLGREIAQVMGHEGAGWLERPRRETSEQPQQAIAALNLKPSDIVADIGAGTGY